jgi:hypothetical protein
MVKVSLLFAFEARRGWMLDLNSWRWPLVLASHVPSGPVLRSPGRSHRKVLLQLKLAVDSFQQMTYGRCLALLLWIGEERYFSDGTIVRREQRIIGRTVRGIQRLDSAV